MKLFWVCLTVMAFAQLARAESATAPDSAPAAPAAPQMTPQEKTDLNQLSQLSDRTWSCDDQVGPTFVMPGQPTTLNCPNSVALYLKDTREVVILYLDSYKDATCSYIRNHVNPKTGGIQIAMASCGKADEADSAAPARGDATSASPSTPPSPPDSEPATPEE